MIPIAILSATFRQFNDIYSLVRRIWASANILFGLRFLWMHSKRFSWFPSEFSYSVEKRYIFYLKWNSSLFYFIPFYSTVRAVFLRFSVFLSITFFFAIQVKSPSLKSIKRILKEIAGHMFYMQLNWIELMKKLNEGKSREKTRENMYIFNVHYLKWIFLLITFIIHEFFFLHSFFSILWVFFAAVVTLVNVHSINGFVIVQYFFQYCSHLMFNSFPLIDT